MQERNRGEHLPFYPTAKEDRSGAFYMRPSLLEGLSYRKYRAIKPRRFKSYIFEITSENLPGGNKYYMHKFLIIATPERAIFKMGVLTVK
jgi:hypothetical protein